MVNSIIGPLLHHSLKTCLDAGSGDTVLNTLDFPGIRLTSLVGTWEMHDHD